MDAVRQPFDVNAIAQAAAAEAIRHSDDVSRRVEQTIAERVRVEGGLAELGLTTAPTEANFSWVSLGGPEEEAAAVAGLSERGVHVRAGTPLGSPGHIRVTYGTRKENERFLAALGEALRLSGSHLLQPGQHVERPHHHEQRRRQRRRARVCPLYVLAI